MGSSSHWGLIITPGQKANGNNLGNYFLSSIQKMVSLVYSLESHRWGDSNEYTQYTISW